MTGKEPKKVEDLTWSYLEPLIRPAGGWGALGWVPVPAPPQTGLLLLELYDLMKQGGASSLAFRRGEVELRIELRVGVRVEGTALPRLLVKRGEMTFQMHRGVWYLRGKGADNEHA